jgi:2'-5' RNA ligase
MQQRSTGGPGGGRQVRVFVAVELPEGLLAALGQAQAHLRAANLPLRLVRPEGIHLTLAFIGALPAARVAALIAAVERGVVGIPVFSLRAEGVGLFPNARRPRVVWVGVQGDADARARLGALHAQVTGQLQAAGFPCDTRFDPHLTIGRVQERATPVEAAQIGAVVQALTLPAPLPFDVGHVSIMHSDLRPGGAVYTRLQAIPLTADSTLI